MPVLYKGAGDLAVGRSFDFVYSQTILEDYMTTTAQLVDSLKATITDDARSAYPIIPFFLAGNLTGGWEGWLQVAFARRATQDCLGVGAEVLREQPYTPASAQRCDLLMKPFRGTAIFCELKTQRSVTHLNAVDGFKQDCLKMSGQDIPWRLANVYMAAMVIRLVGTDPASLRTYAMTDRPTRTELKYLKIEYNGNLAPTFSDVTATIGDVPLGTTILATFRSI